MWEADRIPAYNDPFRPHVSLAYVNADGPAEPIRAALHAALTATPTATIRDVPVLVFHRDNRMYEWTQVVSLPVGSDRPTG